MKAIKFLAACTAACMLCLTAVFPSGNLPDAVPITANAASSGSYGSLNYTNYGSYVEITASPNASGSVDIPASIEGVPVTTIGQTAFAECSGITSVTIPDSVTTIRSYAFSKCESMTSVTISGNATSIGEEAFAYCKSLTSVSIPASVKSIEDSAFFYCIKLKSVYIYNASCTLYSSRYTFSNDFSSFYGTIYGYSGSTAQSYANTYGYKFATLGGSQIETQPTTAATTTTTTQPTTATTTTTTTQPTTATTTTTTTQPTTATTTTTTTQPTTATTASTSATTQTTAVTPVGLSVDQSILQNGISMTYGQWSRISVYNGSGSFAASCDSNNFSLYMEGNTVVIATWASGPVQTTVTVRDTNTGATVSFIAYYGTGAVTTAETTAVTPETTTEVTPQYMLGDVNGDGNIDSFDAADILVAAAKEGAGMASGFDSRMELASDVDKSGGHDAVDASFILQYSAYLGSGQGSDSLEEFMRKR